MRDLRFFAPRGPLQPGQDGKVWAYYEVSDTANPTTIFNQTSYIADLEIDGIAVQVATTHLFSTVGEHLIKFKPTSYTTGVWWNGVAAVRRVYIPRSVSTLGASTFRGGCGAYYADLPSTITSVRRLGLYSIPAMRTVVVRAVNPPSVDNAFVGLSADIYVPYSADHSILAAYKAAQYWSALSSQLYELNPDGTVPTT